MANLGKKRPFSMTLKKRVALCGCLLIILQLLLFNYLANIDKKTQTFTPHGAQVQADYPQDSPQPPL